MGTEDVDKIVGGNATDVYNLRYVATACLGSTTRVRS